MLIRPISYLHVLNSTSLEEKFHISARPCIILYFYFFHLLFFSDFYFSRFRCFDRIRILIITITLWQSFEIKFQSFRITILKSCNYNHDFFDRVAFNQNQSNRNGHRRAKKKPTINQQCLKAKEAKSLKRK